MDIPADWISEAKLAEKIGVADEDRRKFHRNQAKRSDGRRSFYSRLKAQLWVALMTWAVNVAIGRLGSQSVFDPASPPRAALAKLVAPIADPSSVRERLVGSGIEDMSVHR